MSEGSVDFGLISRQQRQVVSDMASLKDDMVVMMAILMRLDGTVSGLVNEVRAQHSPVSQLGSRMRTLEMAGHDGDTA